MNKSILTILSVTFMLNILHGQAANHGQSDPVFIDMTKLAKIQDAFKTGDKKYEEQIKLLLSGAEKLIKMKPLSVMDKSETPPSGDKHDFVSMGPYWWPDPEKPDGLPYIRKDGERNPEYYKITDESYFSQTITAVDLLARAFYITGNDKFASKAAELVRAWFINEATKMNPNMKYAQYIPGRNEGRGIGLIETRYIFRVTDAVALLRESNVWTRKDDSALRAWFEKYFDWITTHKYGIDESNEKNNHGTWYNVQSVAIALFLGKTDYAVTTLEEAKQKRIASQIEKDGKQPLELARTKSWSYSVMNLTAFMNLALLGDKAGVDLWNYSSPEGGSIRKSLDYLLPFAVNMKNWEYKQIDKPNNDGLYPLLLLAEEKYNPDVYGDWIRKIFGDAKLLDSVNLVFVF